MYQMQRTRHPRFLLPSLFLCLVFFAQSASAVDYIWFDNWTQAREACEKAVPFDSRCQPGGFFSYISYNACFGGAGWKYCDAPRYVVVPCVYPAHVDPMPGIVSVTNPGCTTPEPDLTASFGIDTEPRQFRSGEFLPLLDIQITNTGRGLMKPTTTARLYLSDDAQWDDDDVVLGNFGTPSLSAQASHVVGNRSYMIPELEPGNYFVILVANIDLIGNEKSFGNNAHVVHIEVLPQDYPDLVASLDSSAPKPIVVYPGEELPVTVGLSNMSDIERYDGLVIGGIFLSEDETLDEADRPLGATRAFNAFQPSQSEILEQDILIPKDTPAGRYNLLGVVNPATVFAVRRGESPEPAEEEYDNNVAKAVAIEVELPKVEIEICVGNPISTNSGRKLEREVDYQGTGPFPLRFARFYNSHAGNRDGWNTSYSRHLYVHDQSDGTTDVILVFDNAMRYEFNDIDAKGYSAPDVAGFMTRTGAGYSYLDEYGTIHEFDSSGRLTRLVDQTGFAQILSYTDGALTTITGPFGRQLTLAYDANARLVAMQTPDNETYRYEYNSEELLSAVVLPDETPFDTTDNPRRQYLYESPHLAHGLTGVIDENGHRYSTFDYDASGRAILSTHDDGADRNMIAYADDQTTVTNSLGKDATYVFEEILGSKRLTRVDGHASANCPATQLTRTYDTRGSVLQEIDRNGNRTEYTYTHTGLPDDAYLYHVGLVTSRTEAAGTAEERRTTINWHPDLRLPARITEPGRAIEFTYDDRARLIARTEIDLVTGEQRHLQFRHDERGLLIEIDGPRSDVDDLTRLEYNHKGEVTTVVNALGQVTSILDHDANGLPLTVRDPNGLVTRLDYDARRRLTAQTVESDAGDIATDIDYDAKGNVIAIHLPDGQTLHYTYDTADRLITIENDLGERIEFTLDAAGNRNTEVTRAADQSIVRVQARVFDELSRLIETVGAAGQITRLGYDKNDNLDLVQDALGRRTHIHFDALDRLISITDALSGESRFTYDGRDNLTSVTDAEGVTTTYTYDGLNNLIEENSTASGLTQHRYDAAGNRIETVDANGVVMEYTYDALNRLTAVRYPSSPQENIRYHYDVGEHGSGRLTAIDDPSGATAFEYDQRGNLIADHRVIDGIAYTTRYTYNRANQVTKMIYPSGRIVHYELDNLSRVVAITTQANAAAPVNVVAADFEYLPFGPASRWQHGNGLATDIDYDQDYRITDIDVADMNEILSLTYEYNDVSNITRMLDNLGVNSQGFDYDELNRLTFASGNYGEIDYTYDGVGNRQSRTITTETDTTDEAYTYEAGSHRLQSVSTTDADSTSTRGFDHDANGNTTLDVSPERELELIVNARNRLAQVRKDGNVVGEYEYNALGQRVAKTSRYRGRLHAHFDQGQSAVDPSRSEGSQNQTPVDPSRAHRASPERASASRRSSEGSPNQTPVDPSRAHRASPERASASRRTSEGSQNGKAKNSDNDQGPGSSPGHPTRNADGLHSHYDNKPVTERLHFHYDQAGNLIAESDNLGNVIREYLYLGNYRVAMTTVSLDKPTVTPSVSTAVILSRARRASPERASASRRSSEGSRHRTLPLALYFIHNDHLGTPMKVTDTQQRVVWSMEQTPFGEMNLTTEGLRMPMRFPGQYADIESGFSYNYFRDYDPSLGRYIQSDPIGLRGGLNTYLYAIIDPISNEDPSGLIVPILVRSVGTGIFFGALNVISAHIQHPDASYGQLAGAFGVGFATGAFTGIGLGQAGTLLKWIGRGAIEGSIGATGDVALFGGNILDIGIAGVVNSLAAGLANNVALQSALLFFRKGLGTRLGTADFIGASSGALVSKSIDSSTPSMPGLRIMYCGATVVEI